MSTVIERLMAGDQKIVQQCVAAQKYWEEFFEKNLNLSTQQLAQKLDMALFSFKVLFGDDYPFAKEMMPVTCLGALYDDGFEDEVFALRVIAAFEQSSLASAGRTQVLGLIYPFACAKKGLGIRSCRADPAVLHSYTLPS